MSPMTKLLIATAAFLATHYVSSSPLRARLVKLLGNNGYIVLYSSAAIATLVAMVWAYLRAPAFGLWHVPVLRYAPLAVMPFALFLVAAGVLTRNPTAVGQERWLRESDPARGILRFFTRVESVASRPAACLARVTNPLTYSGSGMGGRLLRQPIRLT